MHMCADESAVLIGNRKSEESVNNTSKVSSIQDVFIIAFHCVSFAGPRLNHTDRLRNHLNSSRILGFLNFSRRKAFATSKVSISAHLPNMPIGESSRASGAIGERRGSLDSGSERLGDQHDPQKDANSIERKRRRIWSRVWRHFKRYWLCYGLLGVVFLAIFLPVL